ncbi:MAG: tetratricopeptide repeat protein [Bacteroidetes bacterium]|nr:tetratricopeptide repeat protein [Bacteroidota bacterium]
MKYLLSIYILLTSTRMITTVIHELGHAVAGLFLLDGNLQVYIGSFGDPKKGLHFRMGRLTFHFKYSLFLWNRGLVVPDQIEDSFIKNYLFTLAGPLASFLIAIISLYLLINVEMNLFFWWGALFLIVSSLIDAITNLIPNPNYIILHDGRLTFNDGQTLRLLVRYKAVYKDLLELQKLYETGKIKEGIEAFEKLYAETQNGDVLRMGISFYLQEHNHEKARSLSEELIKKSAMSSDDLCNYAISLAGCGFRKEALGAYYKSLEINPGNFYALNNRGYTYILMRKYKDAIDDFDRAIKLYPRFAYAYNNRGLAKIKLGFHEEGLKDIYKSRELEPENSYAFKNLGIYHKDGGRLKEALENFYKARDLDSSTHEIDDFIRETEVALKKGNENK